MSVVTRNQTEALETHPLDPIDLLKPHRVIRGMSALLLPFTETGEVDWTGFEKLLQRTVTAGLIPAVNMDTGYACLIDEPTRLHVLRLTQRVMRGRMFAAGAFIKDTPGASFDLDAYRRQIDPILMHGGIPVVFQSYGLIAGPGERIVEAYHRIGRLCTKFIAFELGRMFAPFGAIYDLPTYADLLQVPQCIGAKHSSLSRELEWQRLKLRDELRPDFMVLSGNDLAIDMVMYGSDYLLGLSTFAPDLFALRDKMWAAGDPRFYEINDGLQYLGHLAFRDPVPGYKHSAAMFLKLRGWIASDRTHPRSPSRPESDRPILRPIADQLEQFLQSCDPL